MNSERCDLPTIVWDIDDVLNDLTRAWLETAWRPAHPQCRLIYRELTANPPHRLLGISRQEFLVSLDRFRLSKEAEAMTPEPELADWFARYGNRYRHVALTARPRHTVFPAFQWVEKHFGAWFQTYAFVPSRRPGLPSHQPDRNKGDYLAWLEKVDFFVDDDQNNCDAAKRLGIKALLVARPWNGGDGNVKDILNSIVAGGCGSV